MGHLRIGTEIASLDERSEEARSCRRYYPIAYNTFLRSFPWPFATDTDKLILVREFNVRELGDSYGFLYSYRYPANALRVTRVYDEFYGLGHGSAVRSYGGLVDPENYLGQDYTYPYRIVDGSDEVLGKLIFTNARDASAKFIRSDIPPERFDDDFMLALSYRLAYLMAPILARGDDKLEDRLFAKFEVEASKARATSANEENQEPPPDSVLVTSRN